MIRRREVYADMMLNVAGREIPVVSDEHLIEEVAKLLPMVNFAGGVMTIIVGRNQTALEHEMVSTRAIIDWKDRTDARPQREAAEPQPTAEPEPAPEPEVGDTYDDEYLRLAREEIARTTDPDEEEDLSSVPAEYR